MPCRKFKYDLPDYARGGTNPELYATIDRHIAHCRSCASEVESIRRLFDVIEHQALAEIRPPAAGFSSEVIQRIKTPENRRRYDIALMRLGIPLAAASIIAIIAFLLPGRLDFDGHPEIPTAADMQTLIGAMDSSQIYSLHTDYAAAQYFDFPSQSDFQLVDVQDENLPDSAFPVFAGISDNALVAAGASYLQTEELINLFSEDDIAPLLESADGNGHI